jgi:hypothetical protein
MKRRLLFLSSFCLLMSAAAQAWADTPLYIKADPAPMEQAFGKDITSKIFSDELTELRKYNVWTSLFVTPAPNCTAEPEFVVVQVMPVRVDAQGGPIWEERYDIGCEPRVRRSTMMRGSQQGGFQIIEYRASTPGDTITTAKLREDVFRLLKVNIWGAACTGDRVTNTTAVTKPEENATHWKEVWAVQACGTVKDVEIEFVPDAKGGGAMSYYPRIN